MCKQSLLFNTKLVLTKLCIITAKHRTTKDCLSKTKFCINKKKKDIVKGKKFEIFENKGRAYEKHF